MTESGHKKTDSVGFHLQEGPRGDESAETESRTSVSQGPGTLRFTGGRVSVCKVKRVLEIGCTAV